MEELIETEDKPEENSKFKKIILVVVGIVLIMLVSSLVLVSYPVGRIILGQIESDILDGDRIDLDDFSIIFKGKTIKNIKEAYFSEQKVEFSLCLLGKVENGDYYISSIYQPKQFSQTFNHVSFEPCSAETLILFHTHPYKGCIASQTDLNTLKKMQEVNKNVLMVIMCEPERFSVYSKSVAT